MAINDPMYTGVNNIMQAYKLLAETPYLSIWKNKDMICQHNIDDSQAAEIFLLQMLEAAEANENRDILKIKIHPKPEKKYGFITDQTPSIATLFVRVCPWDPKQYSANRDMIVGESNSRVLQAIEGMNSRLKAIEDDAVNDIDDTDGLGKAEGLINGICDLMDKPVMSKLLDRILNLPPTRPPVQQMAGIPDSEKFHHALELLSRIDPEFETDIIKLALIAEKKPTAFKLLIAELRDFKI